MSDVRPVSSARQNTVRRAVSVITSVLVAIVAAVSLAAQAVNGNRTIATQLNPSSVHNALVDDQYYNCINVQAHSLITPTEPVRFSVANLSVFVTLLKGVGSWVTVADPLSAAKTTLSLQPMAGKETCRGTVVEATTIIPGRRHSVRIGTGASAPGNGPPPAPPL